MKFDRREFLKTGTAAWLSFGACRSGGSVRSSYPFHVGTYTRGGSEGIYSCSLDAESGAIRITGVTGGVVNPSFLAIHPGGDALYAVCETADFDGKPGGGVSAYRLDPAAGELELLNRQPSGGTGPCHLTVDRTGRHVLVANYSSGSAAVLPVESDRSLGAPHQVIQHEGSSVHPRRQRGPHAHSVNLDRSNRHAVVADLGLDKLMIYDFDPAAGALSPAVEPFYRTRPGAGPRHFTFHRDGKRAFCINELDSTLTAFDYDEQNGTLSERATVSTLPDDYKGNNTCADVHVSACGRFLYGSNRGHDSIAVAAIGEKNGGLSIIQHHSTGGKTPRNFALDPSGRFLLAANQDSGTIVVLIVDPDSGLLSPAGHRAEVPMPVCIRFSPLAYSR